MSSAKYVQNTYGAEQGYTVPNPIQTVTNAAEAQYAGYYQSAFPAYTNSNVANKEVVYANYAAPNTTTSEVRNTYAFGTGTTGATYTVPTTGVTNYVNNAATYTTSYVNNTAANVASNVRNTVVSDAIAPPPKITFGHPSGGYVTTNTTYYQQPAVNTTTVVTQQQPTVQTITSNKVVQEVSAAQGSVVQQVKTNAPTTTASVQGSSYVPKADDSFLCSKWCWILSAILGVALLTLALLYGLGVIGGPVGKGTEASSGTVAAAGSGKVGSGNLNVNGPHVATPGVNVNGGSVSTPNVNLNGPHIATPSVNVNGGSVSGPNVNLNGGSARVPAVNVNGPSVSGTTSVSPIPSVGVNTNPSVNVVQPTVRPATVAPVSVAPTPVAYNTNVEVRPATVYTQPAVNTQPTVIRPTYVQPAAVAVQPVAVEPSAVSVQPTYVQPVQPTYVQPVQPTYVRPAAVSVQPVSVEPSAVSYQPTYTRPTVQPAAVSVQPVSVQPTVYNGAIRPTVTYPEPTEVYNAPRNSEFVPAVPVY